MKWLLRGVILAMLAALHPLYLYITADVSCLRSACTYLPPHSATPRQAGLALYNAPMPRALVEATLIQESCAFYRTGALQPDRYWRPVLDWLLEGKRINSVSTITQQIAKNIFVGADYSLYRKYREAIYALKLEQYYTKDELLLIYMNIVETGRDMYGFKDAAWVYLHKELDELTAAEAVALVDMLPNPAQREERWRKPHYPRYLYPYYLRRVILLTDTEAHAKQQVQAFYSYLGHNRIAASGEDFATLRYDQVGFSYVMTLRENWLVATDDYIPAFYTVSSRWFICPYSETILE